jgi:hypothetical protein
LLANREKAPSRDELDGITERRDADYLDTRSGQHAELHETPAKGAIATHVHDGDGFADRDVSKSHDPIYLAQLKTVFKFRTALLAGKFAAAAGIFPRLPTVTELRTLRNERASWASDYRFLPDA